MEMIKITDQLPEVSRVALGTWAIGGWLWGGTDEKNSIDTILAASDYGINLIDTAPVYGFGRAEEIVGKAIKKNRDKFIVATKAGLEWQNDESVFRNLDPKRVSSELEDSLKRLQTDYIDLYQVHWPDSKVPIEETATQFKGFLDQGKIRSIGVSNFTSSQVASFRKICPVQTSQPPYNLFERGAEDDILPYSNANDITTLAYGAICRGLLSGRMNNDTKFAEDDIRSFDPKFQLPRFDQYLKAVSTLNEYAEKHFNRSVMQLAIRWILEQGKTIALWGARNPSQLEPISGVSGWSLSADNLHEINHILNKCITDSIGAEFMQSPERDSPDYRGKFPL